MTPSEEKDVREAVDCVQKIARDGLGSIRRHGLTPGVLAAVLAALRSAEQELAEMRVGIPSCQCGQDEACSFLRRAEAAEAKLAEMHRIHITGDKPLTKLCKDCKWMREPGPLAKCAAPQNLIAQVTGFETEDELRRWKFAQNSRLTEGNGCGAKAKWFEAAQ